MFQISFVMSVVQSLALLFLSAQSVLSQSSYAAGDSHNTRTPIWSREAPSLEEMDSLVLSLDNQVPEDLLISGVLVWKNHKIVETSNGHGSPVLDREIVVAIYSTISTCKQWICVFRNEDGDLEYLGSGEVEISGLVSSFVECQLEPKKYLHDYNNYSIVYRNSDGVYARCVAEFCGAPVRIRCLRSVYALSNFVQTLAVVLRP